MIPSTKIANQDDFITFSRQLAMVLNSDLSLYEGLKIIEQKSDTASIKAMTAAMMQGVARGKTLSETLTDLSIELPLYMQTMITIGEQSGELSRAFEQIADNYEKEQATRAKVRAAVTYPAILALLMLGVIALLVSKVLPMFKGILTSLGGDMPPVTRLIMSLGDWFAQYGLILLLLLVIVSVALWAYGRTPSGKRLFDRLRFTLPISGPIASAATAVLFARNLSLLIKSGINTSRAMRLIAPIFENSYATAKVEQAADDIDGGIAVDEAIENMELFPWVLIKLFSVAQMTGHMDSVLDKAAQTMEQALDHNLNRLTTVIEPVLIIILSLIVGAILIAVILPIVNIMGAIG